MKFGLIIPTLNAGGNFLKLLEQISEQTLQTEKLLIDSDSTDGTDALAKKFGFEVVKVLRSDFHHGATRQLALENLLKKNPCDVVIFLTQDIFLHDKNSLAELVKIFSEDESVGVSYGRQLPHENATTEAKFLRSFNYPEENQLRSLEDKKKFGIKTAMNSDSFAAYRVSALEKVGGFPAQVILAEDMFVAAKILLEGYKILGVSFAQLHGGAGVSQIFRHRGFSFSRKLDKKNFRQCGRRGEKICLDEICRAVEKKSA